MLFILTMSMLFCYLFQFFRGKNEQQRVAQKLLFICGLYGMSRMGKCIFLRVGCLFLLWFPMVGCQCRYWRCCKKPFSCNYYNGHPVSLMGRGSTFLSWNKKQSKHALSFFRLFLASFLLFVPVVIEFSVLKNHLALKLLTLSVVVSLILVFLIKPVVTVFQYHVF